jgi:signal peptidase
MAKGTILRAGRLAAGAALAVAVIAAIGVLAPSLWGWQRYAIVSGSMTGTYDRGSLVLADVVPVADLRVGDVITYQPPRGAGPDHLITHRIAWMGRDGAGKRVFRTKGDANPVADPWTFRLEQPAQARARVGIPYVGYALAALGRGDVRTVVITLPALLLAVLSLAGLWRRLGAEAARRGAQASA